jgi:hypothetical protein
MGINRIGRIRRAIQADRYEFTLHALEEMDEDKLTGEDVRHAVLRGRIVSELTDDPRGVRYVVRGESQVRDVELEVVCRVLPSGLLRIITVYALKDEE